MSHDGGRAGATDEVASGVVLVSRPFTAENLPELRSVVRDRAYETGLRADALLDFVAASYELLTNAVRHGGGRGLIRVRLDGRTLTCEVSDQGPGMAELPASSPPPFDRPGGRGLWLARRLSDGLSVASGPDGVTVSVWRLINAHPCPSRGR